MKKYFKEYRTFILFSGFSFALAIIFFNKSNSGYSHDEFEAIHTSWLILNGGNIYIDFFQHHNPLFYYILTPFIYIYGDTISTIRNIRILIWLIFILNFYIIYLYCKLYKIRNYLFIFIALLSIKFYSERLLEIRPDTCMYLSMLYGCYLFLEFVKRKSKLKLYLGAVFLGLSFLFLQKIIIFYIGLLIYQCYLIKSKEISINKVIIFWCITIFTIAIILLVIIKDFNSYFLNNWILNSYLIQDGNNFANFYKIRIAVLKNIISDNKIIILLSLILVFYENNKRKYILIYSIFIVISVFIFIAGSPFNQNYIYLAFFFAITANFAISKIGLSENLIYFVSFLFVVIIIHEQINFKSLDEKQVQYQQIEFILNNTNINDRVYDGDIQFNLFRKDVDYFWFSGGDNFSAKKSFKRHINNFDEIDKIKFYNPKIISNYEISIIDYPNYKSTIHKNIFIRD